MSRGNPGCRIRAYALTSAVQDCVHYILLTARRFFLGASQFEQGYGSGGLADSSVSATSTSDRIRDARSRLRSTHRISLGRKNRRGIFIYD